MKTVILNNTSGYGHFGCERVMRLIEANLIKRDMSISARSRTRNKWWEDGSFLKAAEAADAIIINGEGTFHHGKPLAEKMLSIVNHPVSSRKPVILINAMYQENPDGWAGYLDKFALVSARDSRSAAELSKIMGRQVNYLPDISMSEGFTEDRLESERDLITVGESVLKDVSKALIALSDKTEGLTFLPIVKTLSANRPKLLPSIGKLKKMYNKYHTRKFISFRKNSVFSKNENEYMRYLQDSKLHISGRFHAICFAIVTKTPFLALKSNSWKIEALLDDMGLSQSRIVEEGALEGLLLDPSKFVFDERELSNMTAAMSRGVTGTGQMFDEIANLARSRTG